jgi:hypothetical protein
MVFMAARHFAGACTMFSFDSQIHRQEDRSDFFALQMGQPSDDVLQRQQTDHLPRYGSDAHGVERELQFADLEYRVPQAMG